MKTAAVIPAYEETANIGDIVERTQEYVNEVVVVDDDSADETATIARSKGATVLEHAINTGVGEPCGPVIGTFSDAISSLLSRLTATVNTIPSIYQSC